MDLNSQQSPFIMLQNVTDESLFFLSFREWKLSYFSFIFYSLWNYYLTSEKEKMISDNNSLEQCFSDSHVHINQTTWEPWKNPDSNSSARGEAWHSASVKSSQVIAMLLVHGPYWSVARFLVFLKFCCILEKSGELLKLLMPRLHLTYQNPDLWEWEPGVSIFFFFFLSTSVVCYAQPMLRPAIFGQPVHCNTG